MTHIILTRHGHVEGIDPVRFRGRMNVPLTELGRAQSKAVAKRIANAWNVSIVYTSPMGRSMETGKAIAAACGVSSQAIDALNDIDYGAWQWRTHDEVEAEAPELFAAWHDTPHLVRFPDGEALQDLVARAADALRLVLETHPGKQDSVVLVGHDSVNRALLLQLLDQPLSAYWRIAQSPCTLNEFEIVERRVSALRINETRHLDGIG